MLNRDSNGLNTLRPGDPVGLGPEAITPQSPARCPCGGTEFEFRGLQKLRRGSPEVPLWNCKVCKTTRIGRCTHDQQFLLEIKDGRETWSCWVYGVARSVPHKFKSHVGAGFTPAQKEKEEPHGIETHR